MRNRRFKITVDYLNDDNESVQPSRVFVAEGDSVSYERNTCTESRPGIHPWQPWPKKNVTKHTIQWEVCTYE